VEISQKAVYPPSYLSFVNVGGWTQETDKLRSLAAELGISWKVPFQGGRPREEVLEAARRPFVGHPCAARVAFDLSLLEMMAMGILVLATAARGNVEAFGAGYRLLVAGDKPSDDGSTDNSGDLLRAYAAKHPRITIIVVPSPD